MKKKTYRYDPKKISFIIIVGVILLVVLVNKEYKNSRGLHSKREGQPGEPHGRGCPQGGAVLPYRELRRSRESGDTALYHTCPPCPQPDAQGQGLCGEG